MPYTLAAAVHYQGQEEGNMKTKLLALALLAGGSMFAETRFSIGVNLGGYDRGYYAPPPYTAVRPPCPGPDYIWTDGYWDQDYGRRVWHDGYWNRQSYGYRVQPRYDNGGYEGYGRHDYDRGFRRDRDDDHDRDHRRDYRQGNGYGYTNGFRGR